MPDEGGAFGSPGHITGSDGVSASALNRARNAVRILVDMCHPLVSNASEAACAASFAVLVAVAVVMVLS